MTKKRPQSENIGIIGVGYVGLVTATCLSELGHNVWCYDVDTKKIEDLKRGWMPFFEPGLEKIVKKNFKSGRLKFELNLGPVVKKSKLLFLCVGTPSRKNGSVDLAYVKQATVDIAKLMKEHKIIVVKSTVPAGTSQLIRSLIKQNTNMPFDVVSNPEFLQEGRAIDSFMKADRIVVGFEESYKSDVRSTMHNVYAKLGIQIFETNSRTAEMAKYACNAFLATEISFINNIANLCDEVGADVKTISEVMKADSRIGQKAFLNAGVGYGGICFPKDMRGLINAYEKNGYDPTFFKMVEKVNTEQRSIIVKKLKNLLGNVKGKKIAILGLSFKPETDDIRDAPSIPVISKLLRMGAKVRACDPVAIPSIQNIFGDKINYFTSVNEALQGADALVLLTEWDKFRKLNFNKVKKLMKKFNIVDGRNIYDPIALQKMGFKYVGIGRAGASIEKKGKKA